MAPGARTGKVFIALIFPCIKLRLFTPFVRKGCAYRYSCTPARFAVEARVRWIFSTVWEPRPVAAIFETRSHKYRSQSEIQCDVGACISRVSKIASRRVEFGYHRQVRSDNNTRNWRRRGDVAPSPWNMFWTECLPVSGKILATERSPCSVPREIGAPG